MAEEAGADLYAVGAPTEDELFGPPSEGEQEVLAEVLAEMGAEGSQEVLAEERPLEKVRARKRGSVEVLAEKEGEGSQEVVAEERALKEVRPGKRGSV